MSFSIRAKLVGFSAIGFVLSATVGLTGLFGIRSLTRSLNDVQTSGMAIRNHMQADMMHDAMRGDVLASLLASTPDAQREAISDAKEHSENFRQSLDANNGLHLSDSIRKAMSDAQQPLDQYVTAAEHFVQVAADDHAAAEALLPEFLGSFSVLEERMGAISELIEQDAQASKDGAAMASQSSSRWMMGVMVLALIASAFSAILLVRLINRPIAELIERIKDIAQGDGDLTKTVDESRGDELGQLGKWFNQFVSRIEKVVSEVKAGAVQIDAGGSQIASASQSLAQGASEQASSLQQISASLEEISGQTQQSAENARLASTLAEASKLSADRGQQEMTEMSKAVNEIKQSSSEISKIIRVIDEIAFQTNLLALNAAVEAARAGEAGKGFAVVAEEVRNLAQRSAEAAKSTSAMIEESVKRSEHGVQIAGRVGQALEEITVSTNKVNTLLSEIASAASEQATGVGQINQGVSQLDQVTQQNAGNSEELASSAEQMSSQVSSLNDLVNQFKVSESDVDHGTKSRAKPAAYSSKPRSSAPAPHAKMSSSLHKSAAVKSGGTGAGAGARTNPEQVIPMESDEVLASF